MSGEIKARSGLRESPVIKEGDEKKGDLHTTSISTKRRMILQERKAQSCDARCIAHPQGTNCSSNDMLKCFWIEAERARGRIRKRPFVKVLLHNIQE